MKKWQYSIISLVVICLIWQVAVSLWHVPNYFLPGPIAVGQALGEDFSVLTHDAWVTFMESLIGLALACLIALVTGILMDAWNLLNRFVYPLLVVSQTLPVMVLGPLLTLWFGFGYAPKIILVVLMSYFPIVVALTNALGKVPQDQIVFFQTMGASRFQIYRQLKIPLGMNGFFSGLRVAATYCVGGAVIGEWLNAEAGLGYYMIRAKNGFQIDTVFAAIVWVIVLSLLFNLVALGLEKGYHWLLTRVR